MEPEIERCYLRKLEQTDGVQKKKKKKSIIKIQKKKKRTEIKKKAILQRYLCLSVNFLRLTIVPFRCTKRGQGVEYPRDLTN